MNNEIDNGIKLSTFLQQQGCSLQCVYAHIDGEVVLELNLKWNTNLKAFDALAILSVQGDILVFWQGTRQNLFNCRIRFTIMENATRPVQKFGDVYELGEKLGEGGFGCVYAATEKETGRKVAVKRVLKSDSLICP